MNGSCAKDATSDELRRAAQFREEPRAPSGTDEVSAQVTLLIERDDESVVLEATACVRSNDRIPQNLREEFGPALRLLIDHNGGVPHGLAEQTVSVVTDSRATHTVNSAPIGDGASNAIKHFGNRGSGAAGFPYEIVATATLIDQGVIGKGEPVSLGVRLPGSGGVKGPEADVLVHVTSGPPVALDMKHRSGGVLTNSPDLRAEVERAAVAIRSGQLGSFVFVTNGRATEDFRAMLAEVNARLVPEVEIAATSDTLAGLGARGIDLDTPLLRVLEGV